VNHEDASLVCSLARNGAPGRVVVDPPSRAVDTARDARTSGYFFTDWLAPLPGAR